MRPDADVYRGTRAGGLCTVTIGSSLLKPGASQKVRNHSPDGFEWGYCGSGPAQLALALLLDFTADRETAERWYQPFKEQVVAHWDGDLWSLTGLQIRAWLAARGAAIAPAPGAGD